MRRRLAGLAALMVAALLVSCMAAAALKAYIEFGMLKAKYYNILDNPSAYLEAYGKMLLYTGLSWLGVKLTWLSIEGVVQRGLESIIGPLNVIDQVAVVMVSLGITLILL
ncbi:MAG: hypothetical protein GXO09_02615 [Crenarchaeota archaeon]|nr:hypothetical protein [Thermoproteota archaeon]